MSNICLVVLVGIPGAGKTQFCKYMSDNLHLDNIKLSYISYDEHEKVMEKTMYKNFRSNVFNKVESLINKIIENNSKDNELIIIDDNMFYHSMRRSYYNLARKYSAGFCELFIKCSPDTAIDRNCLRTTDRVPTKVILEMSEKFEPPSKDNSWEKYSCEINSEKEYCENDIKVVSDLIQDALKNPVQAEEQIDDPMQKQSEIHNIDLMLRKLVSRKIKDAIVESKPKLTIEILSQDLLLKRKSIMNGIKNNELALPAYEDDEELENNLSVFFENSGIKSDEEIPNKKAKYSIDTDLHNSVKTEAKMNDEELENNHSVFFENSGIKLDEEIPNKKAKYSIDTDEHNSVKTEAKIE